ncbi:MAG: hypothetical protein JSR39_03820 [Verrucomicrobia bacterium]|nr:hypothetical protein [Verrucomicrobiota bacterium]
MSEKTILCGWKMSINGVKGGLRTRPVSQALTDLCMRYRHVLHGLFFLFFFFLVAFPKGGFKVRGIPFTWGYLFLAVFSAFSFIKGRFSFSRQQLLALLCVLPFAFLGFGAICLLGTTDTGFAASFMVSFLFLPVVFFLFFSKYLEDVDLGLFEKMLSNSLFFVSLFGVFAFFYKMFFFDFLLIPHLMIPVEDIQDFAVTRMIDRGNIFKLVSTYNNGNIYGVCMLMFFNYYFYLEKSLFKKAVFILALILTLSRTVWIGLFIVYWLGFIFKDKTRSSLIRHLLFVGLCIGFLGACVLILNINTGFLFDAHLGGRLWQLETLKTFTLFPSSAFQQIWEIVYLGILENFGLIGLFLFLFGMLAPLTIYFFGSKKAGNRRCREAQNRIAAGLILYLIVCCSDGAIQYIPTMAFFWFLSSLLLSLGNRSQKSVPV